MKQTLRTVRALGDPQRARAWMLLRSGELCVCQIVEVLGLATSTVSRHLAILEQAGLITGRKYGRWIFYRRSRGSLAAPLRRWLEDAIQEDPVIVSDREKLSRVTTCAPETLRERQRKAHHGN